MKNTKCQLCNSKKLKKVIDLGHHPIADTFLSKELVDQYIKVYPLQVMLCRSCGHTMLSYFVSPEERYKKEEYSYTASNSSVSVQHFSEMAKEVSKMAGLNKNDLVIDIGSNDGTLLKQFKKESGCKILGVDPSGNIAKIARKNGIPTLQRFFDSGSVKEIIKKRKKPKVVTATNCLNHVSNVQAFIKNIYKILDKDSFLVFQVPYMKTLLEKGSFDTIYLEHTSYFNLKPFHKFFSGMNLYIVDFELHDYMGGSIRIYLSKDKSKLSKKLRPAIRSEVDKGVFKVSTYGEFMSRIEKFKIDLCQNIHNTKKKGGKIIGIGAATKGNTLLNYCKIDNNTIDFVTDSSPLKIGKFTPGSSIPIKPDSAITKDIDYALILPWNIADFLVKKLDGKGLKFIIPSIK